ncbi:MAG TPA: hypothetical protein VNV44_14445 [Solirubrobacteraceae bacterium]|jgi:hypothetical protein|nr:hypothetical protein [Solirubrobacteraceae bacterium]
MTDGQRAFRNIAIIVALGAAVYFIPGGGRAADGFVAFLWAAFGIGIGYLGLRLYRENQFRLSALGDRHRGMLYGAIALALFCYMGRSRMWETGLGELAWFVLVGLVLYGFLEVYRHYRSYS